METIHLCTRQKEYNIAKAEVVRRTPALRLTLFLIIAVGGTVIGLATILIPIAHFVTTWMIPLVSIFVGLYIFRMGPSIRHIVGTCPVCDAPIDTAGGTSAPDLWIRCGGCTEPLHPKLLDDASPEDNNS